MGFSRYPKSLLLNLLWQVTTTQVHADSHSVSPLIQALCGPTVLMRIANSKQLLIRCRLTLAPTLTWASGPAAVRRVIIMATWKSPGPAPRRLSRSWVGRMKLCPVQKSRYQLLQPLSPNPSPAPHSLAWPPSHSSPPAVAAPKFNSSGNWGLLRPVPSPVLPQPLTPKSVFCNNGKCEEVGTSFVYSMNRPERGRATGC